MRLDTIQLVSVALPKGIIKRLSKPKFSLLARIGVMVGGIGLMIVPAITHNHIYEVFITQTDLPYHRGIIDAVTNGRPIGDTNYLGEAIIGWILGLVSRLLHLDPQLLFVSFLFLSFLAVGVTLYYFGKLIGGVITAWFMLIIGCLCTTSIPTLFSWGTVYSAINMYLILPWAIVLLALWYSRRKLVYLFGGLALLVVFSGFHLTSLYLPYAVGVFLSGFVIWGIVKKKKRQDMVLYGGIALAVLVLNIVIALLVFQPQAISYLNESGKTSMGVMISQTRNVWQFIYQFLNVYLRPATTVIGIICLGSLIYYRKRITFSPTVKAALPMLGALAFVLVVSVVLNFSPDINRQQVDAAGMIALMVAILLGELFKIKSLNWGLKTVCYAVMAVGSLNTILVWVI